MSIQKINNRSMDMLNNSKRVDTHIAQDRLLKEIKLLTLFMKTTK